MLQLRPRQQYALGALAIIIAALVVYFGVIFPRDATRIFPWSSDAWGHLVKAVYLNQQIAEGNFYPDLFPSWYNGQQLLRYFPPLSYYALVAIYQVTGNIYTAGNLFIFGTALFGGLSFLLFTRRIGITWAVAGGILFITFPDNIRVAFAEGNMPRLAAAALLPVAVYFLLNLLEEPERRRNFVALVIIVGLIVLSHAMMAGIFLVGLGMYVVIYWLIRGPRLSVAITGTIALVSGLLISGWWMLPSLTGGLAELNNSEGSEAIATTAPSIALNPALRPSDNETFYIGLSVIIIALGTFLMWKRLEPWSKALLVVTLVMTLIGSTFVTDIWRAMPDSNLFWARRFMTFGGFGLVLVTIIAAREIYRSGSDPQKRWLRLGAIAVLLLVFVDFQPSFQLIHSRERPAPVQQIAEELAILDGWRVATIDLSRLGSSPSMLFTTEGNREQVFGWAFQGSITGPLLARVNESITENYLQYAISRLNRLGTDDVVVLPQTGISPDIGEALEADGYHLVSNSGELLLYHRDGKPRAYTVPIKVLGIGTGANNVALVFPELVVGSSNSLDDYTDEFLGQFDLIVMSRFTTSSRVQAEERVKRLAESGMHFVIDMTAAPVSPLSRLPKFLDVHGEPVLNIEQATLVRDGIRTTLLPFEREGGQWRSVTPQGAQETLVGFEYRAAAGAAVSRNTYGSGDVTFIGLNLFFHASETRDEQVIALLGELLGLKTDTRPADISHDLANYRAADDGWQFDITVPADGWVLFPMAYHDGTQVFVNGTVVESTGIERLTFARMPAGASSVEIRSGRTGIYTAGYVASLIGLLLAGGFLAGVRPQTVVTAWRYGRRWTSRSETANPAKSEKTVAQS